MKLFFKYSLRIYLLLNKLIIKLDMILVLESCNKKGLIKTMHMIKQWVDIKRV